MHVIKNIAAKQYKQRNLAWELKRIHGLYFFFGILEWFPGLVS